MWSVCVCVCVCVWTEHVFTYLYQLGQCSTINPVELISRIHPQATIPHLKQRLANCLDSYQFQTLLNEKCGSIMYQDTLSLSKAYYEGQRRAIRIDNGLQWKCCLCGKSLSQIPDNKISIIASNEVCSQIQKNNATNTTSISQLWKSGVAQNDVAQNSLAIYANKAQSFHRVCYNKQMNL